MERRPLDGWKKALGPEYPSTLASVGGPAEVLERKGMLVAADKMNRRALDGMEKALGPEHPLMLTSVYIALDTYSRTRRRLA